MATFRGDCDIKPGDVATFAVGCDMKLEDVAIFAGICDIELGDILNGDAPPFTKASLCILKVLIRLLAFLISSFGFSVWR